MSNVSESIDWEHTPLEDLHRHRFIARTCEGQTLDGYLSFEPITSDGPRCFDWDYMTEVIEQDTNGHNTLHQPISAINVLKETKR